MNKTEETAITTMDLPDDWPAEWPADAKDWAERMARSLAIRQEQICNLETDVANAEARIDGMLRMTGELSGLCELILRSMRAIEREIEGTSSRLRWVCPENAAFTERFKALCRDMALEENKYAPQGLLRNDAITEDGRALLAADSAIRAAMTKRNG